MYCGLNCIPPKFICWSPNSQDFRIQYLEVKWSEVKSLSRVRLFATPWTVAYKAPLSTEFSRQEYWSGLPLPSAGDLPDPEIEPWSPALQADTFTVWATREVPNRTLKRWLSWNETLWMGPQSYRTAVFLRKEETSGMHRHRGMPGEEMMRRWAPTSKEREKPSLLRFCSWTSSLQKCEKIYFCCLHHLVYSILQWKF